MQASIQSQLNFDASKMFLIDGAYHVLFAVGQITDKKNIDRINSENTIQLIPTAIDLISGMVSIEQQDPSFSFNRYSKIQKQKQK